MTPNILIVDDEPSIVATISAIFETAGYRTVSACSGEEAIAKAVEQCPNLLLCDVMMPGMNGFQVAALIRKSCPACGVLFFSAYGKATRLLDGFAEAVDDEGRPFELVDKPISPSLLLGKVQRALLGAEKSS